MINKKKKELLSRLKGKEIEIEKEKG